MRNFQYIIFIWTQTWRDFQICNSVPLNSLLILFVLGLQVYTLQAAISQSHINFTVSFVTYFYILNMPVDINTWRVVIGLFVNTTQQCAVFHLTKC